ncbi:MAG TPA: geranylgeranylglyceryl/heptaprenylglyceryl phosphate synthase [Bacteroidales bacterium]|nr:geranylgeranylglyceryl/heptaprenylglyceryl phosphate synthase [Bacteroidales bacterium]HBZ21597.1 geranylgeranylglyceryl/heptaprenylglyceryl phosphate synthase [Bacteroidales bacterium]
MTKDNFPGNRSVALLLDPDKASSEGLEKTLRIASECKTDYILAGGSLTFNSIDNLIDTVRKYCNIPIILFPGNLLQLSLKADAILLLSLISGRNPELLIGNHVIAAPYLRRVREKLISVGYILVGSGKKTSVEYISQTEAIPADKSDLVVATALAGEMLGFNMIYLEAGSGAEKPVPSEIISAVRENVSIPIAVGGGLRSRKEISDAFHAGADLIILGNGCEKNPGLLAEACSVRDNIINRLTT